MHGIVVEERDLVIGTHGRGFYVLDNIGVLRQATPELTTNNLFVFETFNPLRGRDRNVTFDYYLGKDGRRGEDRVPRCAGQRAAHLHAARPSRSRDAGCPRASTPRRRRSSA